MDQRKPGRFYQHGVTFRRERVGATAVIESTDKNRCSGHDVSTDPQVYAPTFGNVNNPLATRTSSRQDGRQKLPPLSRTVILL